MGTCIGRRAHTATFSGTGAEDRWVATACQALPGQTASSVAAVAAGAQRRPVASPTAQAISAIPVATIHASGAGKAGGINGRKTAGRRRWTAPLTVNATATPRAPGVIVDHPAAEAEPGSAVMTTDAASRTWFTRPGTCRRATRGAAARRPADTAVMSLERIEPRSRVSEVFSPVLVLVSVMWLAEIVDAVLPLSLDQWGIVGRTTSGLVGVVLSPFLHAGFAHLVANTVPFLVLGVLVAWRTRDRFWAVLVLITVGGGLGVWLLTSPSTLTIGASGVVFGMAAYLVAAGILTRHWIDIVVAVGVVVVYGTMFAGVLPFGVSAGVSWLAHLTGAVAGVGAAFAFARR